MLMAASLLLERTVNLEIEQTYSNLKATLVKKGCKVLSEETPRQIIVKQGSLWGISPKTAKKTVNINLTQVDCETHVTCSSKLSSDWKNLTIIGCILAFALVGVYIWMANDLTAFMVTHEQSFWSWIITVDGNVNLQAGQALVNLTWGLAVFLSVTILLEAVIVVYARSKIDTFARETLNQLS
jgi:hypothetical protein